MRFAIDRKYNGRLADAGRNAEKAVLAKYPTAKIEKTPAGFRIVATGKTLGYARFVSQTWIEALRTVNWKGLIL